MNESTNSTERLFLPPLAELIDRATVTQIKQVLLGDHKLEFARELQRICHDLDIIIGQQGLQLTSEVIRIIVLISQINLHIWMNKDLMQKNIDNEKEYLRLLKLSHQLNGIRNQMKNKLLKIEGSNDESQKRSNFETDGLDWIIDI